MSGLRVILIVGGMVGVWEGFRDRVEVVVRGVGWVEN